ncbi:helix-turn-helix transcriptional regulator [Leptospira haakeii]|uniref:HTH araC/xylS-type domain-containing protein n=1 Tax=Leptospira haakeii TaxID=2023198 RepID=A0ABX4PKN6_9LEPT|nr:AraC family transcriptional regulator [Leptospira haakeii]PKA14953.1 hypothetical protein CH363_16330 [Leptospira haakeii]PKA20394.1 hypothetical protein CH377_05570 [Leptospira haakeii]
MISQLCIWPDKVLYLGNHFETESHSHFLTQTVIGIQAAVLIELENLHIRSDFHHIPANTPHRILEGPSSVLLCYADPHSRINSALLAAHKERNGSIPKELKEDLLLLSQKNPDPISLEKLFYKIAYVKKNTFEIPKIDPRIQSSLSLLREWDFEKRPTLSKFAQNAGLSSGRFTHLFSESLGISFKRFILWTKLSRAVLSLKNGKNLTEACHSSGFSDSSHFSRTFMDMFGVNPSKFLTDSRSVQVYIFDPV